MPRGRCRKKRGPRNVQDKVTTRLMQISLTMDDHIYYSKLVSRAAAAQFLQEIADLKLKCPRSDVRALQVIDKLTMFMKIVIAEDRQQETHLSIPSTPAYYEYSRTRSPVYSLPDEERIENLTLCSPLEDFPMIDITEDSIDTNQKEENNVIDRVNFAISNIAIQDETVSQVQVLSDDDCSQSILDNFHSGDIERKVGTNVKTAHMTDLSNKNPIIQITDELSNDFFMNTLPSTSSTHTQAIVESAKLMEDRNPEIFDFNKENTVSNIITNNQVSMPEEKNEVVQQKKIKVVKKATRKRKLKSNINSDEATEPSSKTNNPRKDKKKKNKGTVNNVPEEAKPLEQNVKETVSMIYNRNVENDLSWVENLRFVREVGPDENDPSLCNLEETFWDNFSLPNQWNDHDFEY